MIKKLFLISSFLALPILASAQKFYDLSEAKPGWKVWDDQNDFDFLISQGDKLTISAIPKLEWDGASLTNPTEVCATYILNNKLLVLTISKEEGVRLRTSNHIYSLADENNIFQYVMNQDWFEIDFGNIVYDKIFEQIIIPCGLDYYNNNRANAIVFEFNAEASSIYDKEKENVEFDESKIKYYDLKGVEVNLDDNKGEILIKTDGENSKKIYNK